MPIRRKKLLADPVRERLCELVEDDLAVARDAIQRAEDIASLLNALDDGEEPIVVDGTVVTGVFKTTKKRSS